MDTPAYSEDTQNLPAYVDSPFLPTPNDSKPAPQSIWIQDTDVSGLYRKRYVLPADEIAAPALPPPPVFDAVSPPTYSSTPEPLYTVKSHGRPSPLDFRGSPPDFTIYLGDGDSGPVVATGHLHTTPLKKSLGEIRFFPQQSSSQPDASSSSAPKGIPGITLKDKDGGEKYTFTSFGYDFEWIHAGPGERPSTPPPPPVEEEEKPTSGGLLSKLKRKSMVKPAASHPEFLPPRNTKTWEFSAYDAKTSTTTKIATYRELQPFGNVVYPYSAFALKYPDGHQAKVEIHEPTFEALGGNGKGARELAVATIMLLVEAQRKKILNAANRSWFDGVVAGGAYGGGCGGGS